MDIYTYIIRIDVQVYFGLKITNTQLDFKNPCYESSMIYKLLRYVGHSELNLRESLCNSHQGCNKEFMNE